MKRIGGLRRKSRYKLKKEIREKGKISVSRYMQRFKTGQLVYLKMEPSCHKSNFSTKFIGRTGIVKGTRGKCYEVSINDQGKEKLLILHPIHLRAGD
jgi:large subunit ribosomal protein L21e